MKNEERFLIEIERFCDEQRSLKRQHDWISRLDVEIPTKEEIDQEFSRIFGDNTQVASSQS